ncbi:hypothetical protein CGCA056_v008496 [Colletotrichum aenigma]|nr:uncharacterized protein CGCA056_v008496 [Colletotrichum aenigma]KAF5520377.1 hypothetical protein CGCA056_v008496 [Colletotrichum aenigma]
MCFFFMNLRQILNVHSWNQADARRPRELLSMHPLPRQSREQ